MMHMQSQVQAICQLSVVRIPQSCSHHTKLYVTDAIATCCALQAVVKPESTQQLAAAVKQFADAAQQSGKPLKIRTSRT